LGERGRGMARQVDTLRSGMDQTIATLPSEKPLVDIHGLAREGVVFDKPVPSQRTLRGLTRQGIIPHFRIGRLIRYDPRLVRAALERQCLVQAKGAKVAKGGTK
jgi:hypothetical protein